MAYADDYVLSQDSTFQNRIRMSMIKIALTVAATPPTTDAVIDGKRNVLADAVLNDPTAHIQRFTLAAIEEGALTSQSSDANLDTSIAAVWSAIAGVTTRD